MIYIMDTMTSPKLRILGMNDEQTHCDKCGKLELRGTVILVDEDATEIGRFGTTCAGNMLGHSVTRSHASNIEAVRRQHITHEIRLARKAIEAYDRPAMLCHLREINNLGIIRPDERAAADEIKATLRAGR